MAQPSQKLSHFHQNSTNTPFLAPPQRHCRWVFDRTGGAFRHQCFFLLQFIPPIFSVKLSSFSSGNFANFTLLFLLHDIYVAFVTYFPICALSYAMYFFFQYLRCLCSDQRLKSILRSYHRAYLLGTRD